VFLPAGLEQPVQTPWRRLEIEVTPESVLVFWESECVGSIRRADLRQQFQDWKRFPLTPDFDNPDVNPGFSPESGLGLCAWHGRAYFKNLVLTPLD
jgi:hypothetical protein